MKRPFNAEYQETPTAAKATTRRTRKRWIAPVVLTAVAALTLTGCSESTQPGTIAVVINGDMFPTDPSYLPCMQPGTNEIHIFDDVFRYPSRQISWDATGEPGSEHSPYVVVSSVDAPAKLNVPVVVTMDLTTDCDLLNLFHSNLGTKYQAWINSDGTVPPG